MATIDSIPCVILCGGKSSRMGEDKSLLSFGGFDTLAQFQYERFKNHFLDTYISCKSSSIYNFNVDFIEDENSSSFNPFNGIVSSFNAIAYPYIFFTPVDYPFLSIETIKILSSSLDCSLDGVVAKEEENGVHNLITILSISVVPTILDMIKDGDFRVSNLIKRANIKIVELPKSSEFLNMNFKDEYMNALKN